MKNDPTYAFGHEVAGLLLEISDLENALSEASARSDVAAVHKIKTEIALRESEAYALSTVQLTRRKAPSVAPTSQRGASAGQEGKSITLADLIDHRSRLLGFWKEALSAAPATGNWRDVEGCGRICEAFHDEVRKLIASDAFSGDVAAAASAWDECGRAESEYRRLVEAEARSQKSAMVDESSRDGEAKEVMRVKMICEVAHSSAQTVREGKEDAEWLDHERKRYEKHRATALDAAKAITDEFYRDAAVHNIVDLCMIAGDRDVAKAVLRAVRTDYVRDKILEAYPALR
jgi:hypothetical protein